MFLFLRRTKRANYGYCLQLVPADVVAAAAVELARKKLDGGFDEDKKRTADFVDEHRRRSCKEERSCQGSKVFSLCVLLCECIPVKLFERLLCFSPSS